MKNRIIPAAAKSALLAGSGEAVNSRFLIAQVCAPPPTAYAKRCLTGWLRSLLTPNVWIASPEAARWGWKRCRAMLRGATLIEMDRAVSQQLIKNLATLKAGNARVVNSNAMSFLAQKGTPR